jgi:hypothetical protein
VRRPPDARHVHAVKGAVIVFAGAHTLMCARAGVVEGEELLTARARAYAGERRVLRV